MSTLVVDALREAERLGRVEGELLLDGLLIEVDRGVVRHLPGSCVLSLLLLLLMVAVGWQLVGRGMMETMQRWCFFCHLLLLSMPI